MINQYLIIQSLKEAINELREETEDMLIKQ